VVTKIIQHQPGEGEGEGEKTTRGVGKKKVCQKTSRGEMKLGTDSIREGEKERGGGEGKKDVEKKGRGV